MRLLPLLPLLALAAPLASAPLPFQKPDAGKEDLERLQGEWEAVTNFARLAAGVRQQAGPTLSRRPGPVCEALAASCMLRSPPLLSRSNGRARVVKRRGAGRGLLRLAPLFV